MGLPIVIISDDHGSEWLLLLIKKYISSLDVKYITSDLREGVSAIELHKPIILLLDIEMTGNSYTELLARTRSVSYHTIFIAPCLHRVQNTLRKSGAAFVPKPVDAGEFITAVNKVIGKLGSSFHNLNLFLGQPRGNTPKLTIPTTEGLLFLETGKIIRLEADSNYTHIFISDGRKITASKTLKEFESVLDANAFLRVHSTHIINLSKIERYIRGDGGYIVLENGQSVPVSRSQKTIFLSRFAY